jgi:hypothetical protein
LRAPCDGLFRYRLLLGLAHCIGDLVLFKSEWVLENHLDG